MFIVDDQSKVAFLLLNNTSIFIFNEIDGVYFSFFFYGGFMPSKLFVGNLAFSATEDAVKTLFSQYGEVSSVNIITDKMSGRPRGFCFVEMENAEAAIEGLNDSQFEGRKLNVNVAQQKPQGSGGGGGGHPRGNGGGGFNRDRGDRGNGGGSGGRRNDRW